MKKPVVLVVLDGWGLAPPGPGNAISQLQNSVMNEYWHSYPHTELHASGQFVGLPNDEDGNTETGHINIGAGRIVYQDLLRINHAIEDGSFYRNEAFIGAVRYTQQHQSNLHILGLLSDSGVHADRDHLYALLHLIKMQNFNKPVYLHLFTDGRDSPPEAGIRFIRDVEQKCQMLGIGQIATIMGRYFAMDRDRRWERTQKAYEALTENISVTSPSAEMAIENSYKHQITDEFILPTIILDKDNKPLPRIQSNDAVIFYNFRVDRPRQLTRAFILPNFETHQELHSFDPYEVKYFHKHIIETDSRKKPFTRNVILKDLFFVTMTEYEREVPCIVAYPPVPVNKPFGEVISAIGWRQLRVSETEKERFVTFYFNGMREMPFNGEDRLIIPSPKVATYDLQPEMSANEMTDKVIDRINLDVYNFILINYANADMVGHTGNISAAVKACSTIDQCLRRLVPAILARDGTCIITGDHGNVEEMLGPNGEMDTEHSTFPVPLILINNKFMNYPLSLPMGKLGDIAPTILSLSLVQSPKEMTGTNLLSDTTLFKGGIL